MSQSIEALEDLLASKLPLTEELRKLLSTAVASEEDAASLIGRVQILAASIVHGLTVPAALATTP
jgi:hypothetical protein